MTTSKSELEKSILDRLREWMDAQEGEHFEFKEAKTKLGFDELAKYCCALANEGGGRLLLGVTNKRPRRIVGSQAFPQREETRRSLMQKIPLRIEILSIEHVDGRVVVFEVPARPVGVPLKYDGIYWSRENDSLVPMSEEKLRLVFGESGHDFSADVCRGATVEHLEPLAIEDFRRRWLAKSKNPALSTLDHSQLLRDAEVILDGGITYAALILFGTRSALGRFLGQSECVFEYRSSEAPGPAQQRKEYRQGFFSFYDDLWNTINLRNDLQHYQDGLFVLDIPTFAERSVREAILNAVSHRDYQLGGSVFVRQYARRLVIESPGGFPVGVTQENILDRQSPRNRRIADVFARCGLVDRSGQGMNLMFEQSIRQGKLRPDFHHTDAYQVMLTLHGEMTDPRFVRFLEKVGEERLASFDVHDFLILDLVHREQTIPPPIRPRLRRLIDLGVIESAGRGRYVLSRRFYAMFGEKGAYTRRRGLDRETNKELLVKHIEDNSSTGSTLQDLCLVLPSLSAGSVQWLLRQLKNEGRIRLEGKTRAARWFPMESDASSTGGGARS